MQLAQLFPTVETCLELKKYGYEQNAIYAYWLENGNKISMIEGADEEISIYAINSRDFSIIVRSHQFVSAPTSSEIIKKLPASFIYKKTLYTLEFDYDEGLYRYFYDPSCKDELFTDEVETYSLREAEARARAWIELRKRNLI